MDMKFEYSLENINSATKKILKFLDEHNNSKIVLFNGKMGTGKTTLIKKICSFLNVKDEVTSPSFAIINEYFTYNNNIIYHFDFYRLKNIQEAIEIGTEDYFYTNNYCFIEWGKIIEPILPENYIQIDISETNTTKRFLTLKHL